MKIEKITTLTITLRGSPGDVDQILELIDEATSADVLEGMHCEKKTSSRTLTPRPISEGEEKNFRDGYNTGINWKHEDKWKPGGPWVRSGTDEKALMSRLENAAWRAGWRVGYDVKCGAREHIIFTDEPIYFREREEYITTNS